MLITILVAAGFISGGGIIFSSLLYSAFASTRFPGDYFWVQRAHNISMRLLKFGIGIVITSYLIAGLSFVL